MKIIVGYRFVNKEGCVGVVTAIRSVRHATRCRTHYTVLFEDSGHGVYTTEATLSNIRNGQVKNKLHPTVCGVGFIGVGTHKVSELRTTTRQYRLWKSMMERCYSVKYLRKRPTYRGCHVCDRWHNFQLFCEDICKLVGYEAWLNKSNNMQLDKDIRIVGNKMYSCATCMFVSAHDNNSYAQITGKTYLATRLSDNYTEQFTNQTEFAATHLLCDKGVSACINGKYKSTRGWIFTTIN